MKLDAVKFSYGKNVVLEDISYEFKSGKIYGIVGHNGAGKTTLLRILLGLLSPTEGRVITSDVNLMSYVPERQGVYSDLTVFENLYVAYKLFKRESKNSIDELLNRWHLHSKRNELARNLSTGMLARLKFLCANVENNDVLICDEPTMGVDARTQKLMENEMRSQKEQGKIVIISSHNIEFIDIICDEVIIINEHRIVFAGKMEEIHNFEELYLDYAKEEENE